MQTPKGLPIYADLLSNFKVYKNIIRRSIMHAKRDYYRNVFHKYSSNLKKTWQIIKESLNRRKGKLDFPQEFQLANGTLILEPKQIANAFNNFLSLLVILVKLIQQLISISICLQNLIAI